MSGYDALDELYEKLRDAEETQRAGGITPETIRAARGGAVDESGRTHATAAENAAGGDSEPLADISRDTRERIEADAWEAARLDMSRTWEERRDAIVALLDRQAALTERETKLRELYKFEENHREHVRSIEEVNRQLNERIAELQDDNDYLQKRMLGLEDEVLSLQSELDDSDGEIYCGATIEEWHELAVRMEAERDRLQDVVALLRAAQVAHRETRVLLPVDADGVPIRVGDVVDSGLDSGKVLRLELWSDGWVVVFDVGRGNTSRYEPTALRHVEPSDSWERICADLRAMDVGNLIAMGNGQYVEDTRHDEIAERIERMARA